MCRCINNIHNGNKLYLHTSSRKYQHNHHMHQRKHCALKQRQILIFIQHISKHLVVQERFSTQPQALCPSYTLSTKRPPSSWVMRPPVPRKHLQYSLSQPKNHYALCAYPNAHTKIYMDLTHPSQPYLPQYLPRTKPFSSQASRSLIHGSLG